MTTTFVNRENTNEVIFQKINNLLIENTSSNKKHKQIIKLSEDYEQRRTKLGIKLIADRENKENMLTTLTFNKDTLLLNNKYVKTKLFSISRS